MSSSQCSRGRLGGRNCPSPWGIAQVAIQKQTCGGEMSRNALSEQLREWEIDQGICWEGKYWGNKASWWHRDTDAAGAGKYQESCKCRIDNQRAQRTISGDNGCYQRQSVWRCKFRLWGGWGRWWSSRYSAWQAERRKRTWLGSVSNGNGLSLQARVRVLSEPLPNWGFRLSINPNCHLRYGSMVYSQPIWIGRVVSGSPSGSMHRFN